MWCVRRRVQCSQSSFVRIHVGERRVETGEIKAHRGHSTLPRGAPRAPAPAVSFVTFVFWYLSRLHEFEKD